MALGLFFGSGWGAGDPAFAAQDDEAKTRGVSAQEEDPTPADPTGAYLIAPSFSSLNASTDGTKSMRLNGDAVLGAGGEGEIVLVPDAYKAPKGYAGNAFLSRPIYSETGFSSMFEIYMGSANKVYSASYGVGDGWSFVVSKDANTAGEAGSGLGYTKIPNSFGLGVDTFNNTSSDRYDTDRVPAIDFGKNGVWEHHYGGTNESSAIDERNAVKLKPGTTGVEFTAADINNLSGADIRNPGSLANARNYSLYCWVDYNVVEDYINIYMNIFPVKPTTPVISKTGTGIPNIIGDTYYIGFAAGQYLALQHMSLRQLYVLNSYDPAGLEFNDDGTGIDPDLPLVEDFTAPTAPVISQLDITNFTFGASTDNYGVKKYQYRYSLDGTNSWTDWTDYKTGTGEDYILDGLTPVALTGLTTELSRVQARAVDTSGNISSETDYIYMGSPRPVVSLTSPVVSGSALVRVADAQSLTLSFSQPIDVSASSPGAVIVTGASLAGGAVKANDTRWNASHNQLVLPLSGVTSGSTYEVGVTGFVSEAGQPQKETNGFTYTVMPRKATPEAAVDYANEKLTITEGALKSFIINGQTRAPDASGQIPLVGSGYNWIGQSLQIVSPGDGVNADDSAALLLQVPARPAAPSGLSGMDSKLYGVSQGGVSMNLEYTQDLPGAPSRTWTNCTVDGTDSNGSYMNVSGNLYVRKKTTESSFAGGESNLQVASKSVTLTLGAPTFGHVGHGAAGQTKSIGITATGNTSALVNLTDITITPSPSAFELILPKDNLSITPGSVNLELRVRPTSRAAIGEHAATVKVTYSYQESESATFTATTDLSVVVTEPAPTPDIDYASAKITGLAPSAAYVIDGAITSPMQSTYNGTIDIAALWFGRGAGSGAPLQIQKYNVNPNLNSDAISVAISARALPPQAIVTPETYTGFTDSVVSGVTDQMEFSQNNGANYTDLKTDDLSGKYDRTKGTITGLKDGPNYRLRIKADPVSRNFASLPQTIVIAPSKAEPTYDIRLDTSENASYTFQSRPYRYSESDASSMAHTVSVQNTGNQPLTGLKATLDGTNSSAFSLVGSAGDVSPGQTNTTLKVRPAADLAAGEYSATLRIEAPYSGPSGSSISGTAIKSYGLKFEVEQAEITGFTALADWFPGKENTPAILTNLGTAAKVAAALKTGLHADGIDFAGYPNVTAHLEGGGLEEIAVSSWGTTSIPPWNAEHAGSYTFQATLGNLGANITNAGGLLPTVRVVLNDLDYGVSLDREGTSSFPSSEYGYKVASTAGGAGLQPIGVTIRNLGVNATGGLTAALSGTSAGAFELSLGASKGQSLPVDSLTSQGEENAELKVTPKPGLAPNASSPKTYSAKVTISGGHEISQSFNVSFTVNPAQITGFVYTQVDGGRTGAPTLGSTSGAVIARLNSEYTTVSATYAGGTAPYPVTGWAAAAGGPSYNKDMAGVYGFTGTLGTVPPYFTFGGGSSPQLSVVIAQTVNAAQPSITRYPNGGESYTSASDPGHPFTLSIAATASDLGAGGELSYQWYKSGRNANTGGTAIVGATKTDYEAPRATAGTYYYYCEVTNTNNSVNGKKTATAVSPPVSVSVQKRPQLSSPVITDPGAKEAGDATFNLGTTGGNGTGAVTFVKLSGADSVATVTTRGAVTVHGAGQIEVAATKAGDADWLAGAQSASLIITVEPKQYTLAIPIKTAAYGLTLSNIPLGYFGQSGDSPAGTWSWEEALSTPVGDAGVQTHLATFTPDDTGKYATRVHIGVAVTVSPKTITASGPAFADKKYDGTTGVAIKTSAVPSGVLKADESGVTLIGSGVSWAFGGPSDAATVEAAGGVAMSVTCTGDYLLAGTRAFNYALNQPSGQFSARILPGFDAAGHYSTSLNEYGATNGNLTVTANQGYMVAAPAGLTDPGAAGPWSGFVTLATKEVTSTSAAFYVRRTGAATGGIATNEISKRQTITYTIDLTAPAAKVQYKESGLREFLNAITFGLFFKDTVVISLQGSDNGSGVAGLQYYIDPSPSAELPENTLAGLWEDYDDGNRPSVSPNAKIALYVKVLDKAGNSQIYKDGVVIYKDAAVNTQKIHYVKTSPHDVPALVTLNGNTIRNVKYEDQILTPSGVGAAIEIGGANITFKASYLGAFDARDEAYPFTVSYDPLGEPYPSSDDDRNEAPSTTAINLYVTKCAVDAPSVTSGGVSMTGGQTTDGRIETTHGAKSFTLSAILVPEGGGNYVWTVSPSAAAPITIGAVPGAPKEDAVTVTTTSVGRAEISVYRQADDNYKPSPARKIEVVVTDNTAPTPGGVTIPPDPAVTHSAFTAPPNTTGAAQIWSTSLSWMKATDDITPRDDIGYSVYLMTGAGVNTTEEWAAYGRNLGGGDADGTDKMKINLTGLTRNQVYSVGVVAQDKAGNKSVYTKRTFAAPVNVTFKAEQVGGRNGTDASQYILVTFGDNVSGLEGADENSGFKTATVTGGAARKSVAMDDAGDHGGTTYRIPITPVTNAGIAQVNISGWTQKDSEEDGGSVHTFGVISRDIPARVWAPVPEPTPDPVIDFENEKLTGLEPGATYKLGSTYAPDNYRDMQADDGGTIRIDSTWMQTGNPDTLWLSKKGKAPAEEGQSGTVDSAKKNLTIPKRLAEPEAYPTSPGGFIVVQPTASSGALSLGGLENVTNAMQYRRYDAESMEWKAWTNMGLDPGVTTKSGLAPGQYGLRTKCTGKNFASNAVPFFIREYGASDFKPLIEGYGADEVTSAAVEAPAGYDATTITAVWFWEDGEEVATNASFTLTRSAIPGENEWFVTPKTGLGASHEGTTRPKAYTAQIRLTFQAYEGGITIERQTVQNISLTVHPKAELAAENPIVASDEDADGDTDTITIHLKYPMDLTWSVISATGGANKNYGKQTLTSSDDKKTHSFAVIPNDTATPGALITVSADYSGLAAYAAQTVSVGGSSYARLRDYARVAISRSIDTARTATIIEGYPSSYVQFTLDGKHSIVPAQLAEYPTGGESYSGRVRIDAANGSEAAVTVAAVFPVTNAPGYSAAGAYTYRAFFFVSTPGAVEISIPSYRVTRSAVEGEVMEGDGKSFKGFMSFLGSASENYPSDMDGNQKLGSASFPGQYRTAAYDLYTSMEYASAGGIGHENVEVYIDSDLNGKIESDELLDASLYTVTGAGVKDHWYLDDVDQGALVNQLRIILKEGWTMENSGKPGYVIAVVVDGYATRGIIEVSGLKPTYTLKVKDGRATGAYGLPALSRYEPGQLVQITANAPTSGLVFDKWTQTSGPGIDLPGEGSGFITMPAGNAQISAEYKDGLAPVTSITPADGGWSTGKFTLSATDVDMTQQSQIGQIKVTRYSLDGGYTWERYNGPAPLPEEGRNFVQFYSEDAAGNVEKEKTVRIYRDSVAPGSGFYFNGSTPDKFDADPEVVHFYRGEMTFYLVPGDPGVQGVTASMVDKTKTQYLITSAQAFKTTAAALAADGWQAYAGDGFTVSKSGVYYVYAQVHDNAGNITVVNSQGVVIYENSARDTETVEFTRLSNQAKSAIVKLNGNSVADVTEGWNGGDKLIPGVDYTLNLTGDAITFFSSYLERLGGGDHPLVISYNPQGQVYVPVEVSPGNQLPQTTSLTLRVKKATPTVTLKVFPQDDATYSVGGVQLTAEVKGVTSRQPTGMVAFYDGNVALSGQVALNAGGQALAQVTLGAGTHTAISVRYLGDAYYTEGTGPLDKPYTVAKATQDTPAITGPGVVGNNLTKTYGDAPFLLSATGGKGNVECAWESLTPSVAAIGASNGYVTVKGQGAATLRVKILANENYKESDWKSIVLNVNSKPVTIKGVSAKDKVYDGTALAYPVLTGASIEGKLSGDELSILTGSAMFTDINADAGKKVSFTGFGLTGAAVLNYTLSTQPALAAATIHKATPKPDANSPAASAVTYGERVSDSALSGRVNGVNGQPIGGSWSWTGRLEEIPGVNGAALDSGGYPYLATFTPTGAAAVNYMAFSTNAAIRVNPAVPRLANGGTKVQGTSIFVSSAGISNTLADVSPSGIVCGVDGAPIGGSWSWVESTPQNVKYEKDGETTASAIFKPASAKYIQTAFTVVFGVVNGNRTHVASAPAISSPAAYGSKVENVSFDTSKARVVRQFVSEGAIKEEEIAGDWAWEDGNALINSRATKSGIAGAAHTAILSFTPENAAYLPSSAQVDIPVEKVRAKDYEPGEPPAVTSGQALSASAIGSPSAIGEANSGFRFKGVIGEGELITGTLAWKGDADTLVKPGVSYPAVFTPTDGWENVYEPFEISVKVKVLADEPTKAKLGSALTPLDEWGYVDDDVPSPLQAFEMVATSGAYANYDPADVKALEDAIAAIRTVLEKEEITQSEADGLLAEAAGAMARLVPKHPIVESNLTITEKGKSAKASFRGVYTGLTRLSVGGKEAVLSPTPNPDGPYTGPYTFTIDGRQAGVVRPGSLSSMLTVLAGQGPAGSVIVEFDSGYLDALDNGSYVIRTVFTDLYYDEFLAGGTVKNEGVDTLVIRRPAPIPPQPDPEPPTPAPPTPTPTPAAPTPTPAAPDYPAVGSIRTPITSLSMVVGKSLNLKNMVGVYDAANKPISDPGAKWASSKPDVAAVSASGAVKAGKKPGKTVISLTAQNGRALKVSVTVVKKAKKLKKLSGKVPALKVGKPAYITLKGAGTNITGYKWKVKGSGLKIDKFGMATATKKGKFTITVTAGGKKWVKKVTVK